MDDLQTRLHRLAEHTAPPPRADLAGAVVARHRQRRRQTAGLAAVAVAVAAVVAVPVAVRGGEDAPTVAAGVAAPGAASGDVLSLPTRGSLAGDPAFVEAVRQLPWSGAGAAVPDPAVADRHVVFAGDVAGARWALVAAPNLTQPPPLVDDPQLETDLGALGSTLVAWSTGPPGATPGQMTVQDVPHAVDPALPLAYADTGTGAVLVVAAPGDVVSVSERPEVAADGRTSRTWTEAEAPDGVAVLARPPSPPAADTAFRYRVVRNGVEVVAGLPASRSSVAASPSPELRVTWARERPPAAPGDVAGTAGMASLLSRTGLPADEVPVTVLWAGDVPAAGGATARLTVFSAVLPPGAVYVGTAVGAALDASGVGATGCGSQLRPAGDGVGVVAAVCEPAGTGAGPVRSLVVVAPPGAASVRLLDGAGGVLATQPLDDGVAVLTAPGGLASVETLDASGAVVERTEPLGEAVLD